MILTFYGLSPQERVFSKNPKNENPVWGSCFKVTNSESSSKSKGGISHSKIHRKEREFGGSELRI